MRNKSLIVEYVDPAHGFVVGDGCVSVHDVPKLIDILGVSDCDPTFEGEYELTAEDFSCLAREKISIKLLHGRPTSAGTVRRAVLLDDLPYVVHTNRELPLMLEGMKPLAAFCAIVRAGDEKIHPWESMSPFVQNGQLTEHSFLLQNDEVLTKYQLYSLPSESWRLQAYELLMRSGQESGWNESMERMQGSLLGYSEEENDMYINKIFLKVRE